MPFGRPRLQGAEALVTGGCGFIGAHLARALDAAGARVTVLDRPGVEPTLPVPGRRIACELGRDKPVLGRTDLVFHLAARKHSGRSESPAEILRTNVLGTQELLDAAVAAGAQRVVFTSSLFAYGRTSGPPMREDETPRPANPYGISKLAGEQLVAASPLESVSLRYFFVYGPGQHGSMGYRSVITRNVERLLRGETATVYGDGRQELDYVFVDDVIDATLRAATDAPDGALYNVGSGRGVSVNALLDELIAAVGGSHRKEQMPADDTTGTSRVADAQRIKTELGWQATTPLSEGLRRTADWVRGTVTA